MDDLEARTQKELADIVIVLTELTGLPSRWSGRVELVPDAKHKGLKQPSCGIEVDAQLAEQDLRWLTLTHEALHSLSPQYNSTDFRELRGWEEGVVEQLQRLFRPEIFSRLGIRMAEDLLLSADLWHPFNPYIAALERLRLSQEAFQAITPPIIFYMNLIALPIKDRPASIFRHGFYLQPEQRSVFMAIFSQSNAILKRRIV